MSPRAVTTAQNTHIHTVSSHNINIKRRKNDKNKEHFENSSAALTPMESSTAGLSELPPEALLLSLWSMTCREEDGWKLCVCVCVCKCTPTTHDRKAHNGLGLLPHRYCTAPLACMSVTSTHLAPVRVRLLRGPGSKVKRSAQWNLPLQPWFSFSLVLSFSLG